MVGQEKCLHTVFNYEPQLSCLWLPATSKSCCTTSTFNTVLLLYCCSLQPRVLQQQYILVYVVSCVCQQAMNMRRKFEVDGEQPRSALTVSTHYLRPRCSALSATFVMLSYFVRSYSIHLVLRVLFLSTLRAAAWGVPPPKWGRSRQMVS